MLIKRIEEQVYKPPSNSESLSSSKQTFDDISCDVEEGLVLPKSILNPKTMSRLDHPFQEYKDPLCVEYTEEIIEEDESYHETTGYNILKDSKTEFNVLNEIEFVPKEEVIYEILYQQNEIDEDISNEEKHLDKYKKYGHKSPERSKFDQMFNHNNLW